MTTQYTNRQPAGIPVGGQFAPTTKSEPAGLNLSFEDASGNSLIAQRIQDRDEIREILENAEDPTSREMQQLDRLHQHLSIQLAATGILQQFPGSSTVVLRENEDGENQYDLLAIQDAEGNEMAGRGGDWTRNEIAGPNSPQLDELCWALDTKDDGWAKGIGGIASDRYNGKTAKIDLVSAVDKVAPPRSIAAVEAAEQYAAAQERMEHLRKQNVMIQEINDHASMRLVAAGILDKYPDARLLKCSRDINSDGRLEVIAVLDADGNVVADPDFDTELNDVDLLGGNGPTVRTLVQCMDPYNLGWATMIGEVRNSRYQTYVNVDLHKAMNQEKPDDERLKDPRVRPLSPQNQSDLVTAAEFGLKQIEEAIAGAENSHQENWLRNLAERTQNALKP